MNLTISDFEKSINVTNGYVNSISKSIGVDKIKTILEKYPNVDLEWLLTGKGEMLKAGTLPPGAVGAEPATRQDEGKEALKEALRDKERVIQLMQENKLLAVENKRLETEHKQLEAKSKWLTGENSRLEAENKQLVKEVCHFKSGASQPKTTQPKPNKTGFV